MKLDAAPEITWPNWFSVVSARLSARKRNTSEHQKIVLLVLAQIDVDTAENEPRLAQNEPSKVSSFIPTQAI